MEQHHQLIAGSNGRVQPKGSLLVGGWSWRLQETQWRIKMMQWSSCLGGGKWGADSLSTDFLVEYVKYRRLWRTPTHALNTHSYTTRKSYQLYPVYTFQSTLPDQGFKLLQQDRMVVWVEVEDRFTCWRYNAIVLCSFLFGHVWNNIFHWHNKNARNFLN